MSHNMFRIGADKLERLHAEAAERSKARHARPVMWKDFVRRIGERLERR